MQMNQRVMFFSDGGADIREETLPVAWECGSSS